MPSIASQALTGRLTELAERALANTGIELVELEVRGAGKARMLRLYIDKPGGVTHSDCELASERFGQLLDEEDVMEGDGYTLEVSSPGVERKLSKPRDFERVVGQSVRVAFRDTAASAAAGAEAAPDRLRETIRKLEGKLTGFANETLTLETASGETQQIPLAQVQKANLKFEW